MGICTGLIKLQVTLSRTVRKKLLFKVNGIEKTPTMWDSHASRTDPDHHCGHRGKVGRHYHITYEMDLILGCLLWNYSSIYGFLLLHSANLGRQEKVRPLFHILLKRTKLQRVLPPDKIKQAIRFKTHCVLGKLNFSGIQIILGHLLWLIMFYIYHNKTN